MKRLLLLALLLATPAWAAPKTWWVSPTGSAVASGADSTTNATTLARVNTSAVAGDIVRFKSGVYSDPIQPTHDGYGARIKYYGFPNDPGAVTVTDIIFGYAHGKYCTAKWFTTSSALTGCYGLYADPDHPHGDSLTSIRCPNQGGDLWFTGDSCYMDSCVVTGTITSTYQRNWISFYIGNEVGWHPHANVLKNNIFTPTVNAPTCTAGIRIVGMDHDSTNTFDSNTFNVHFVAANCFFFVTESYITIKNTWKNNTFNVVTDATPGGFFGLFSNRDSSMYNHYQNNTITMTGAGNMQCAFSHPGSVSGSQGYNYFEGNNIRVDNPRESGVYYYDAMNHDVIQFNTIAVGNGKPALLLASGAANHVITGAMIRHNTFFTTGPICVDLSHAITTSNGTLSSNIYYAGAANGTNSENLRALSGVTIDSAGVFYSVGGTAGKAISVDAVDSAPPGLPSLYADPLFSNSSYATLNTNLATGSPAVNASYWNGFAGAYGTAVTPTTWTITSSYTGGLGSVSPTSATVVDGGSQTVTIAPATGYHITDVSVDGASQGVIYSYAFTTVTANHTLLATFAINTYTLNAGAGFGGTINPSGATSKNYGDSQTYAITASPGHSVADVAVDDESVGAVTSYPFTSISASHTIQAFFGSSSADSFAIVSSAGAGGSISPDGTTNVISGGSQAYTVTAFTGYHVADILVDGVSAGTSSPYTFSNVTTTHTIAASFGADSVAIISTAGSNGLIYPSGATHLITGGSQTYTIWPNILYGIADVLVDGVSVGAVASYAFSNVTADHTIAASFVAHAQPGNDRITYTIPGYPHVRMLVSGNNAGGSTPPVTYPMVKGDGTTNAATISTLANYQDIMITIAAVDSSAETCRTCQLNAIRALRAANPAIVITGYGQMDAGYYGGESRDDSLLGNPPGVTARWRYDMWNAGVKAHGWTSGNGRTSGPDAGADTCTGTNGFLWNHVSGWRGSFFGTRAGGGGAGGTLCNLNLAYRNGVGGWPVRDSVLACHIKAIESVDPITKNYLWDGIFLDLSLHTTGAFSGDTVDYARAGYGAATNPAAAFDTAWFDASTYIFKRLREHADSLGRTSMPISANGATGIAHAYLNGWTMENFPNQQDGTWLGNFLGANGITYHTRSAQFESNLGYTSNGLKYKQFWPVGGFTVWAGGADDSLCGARGDTALAARKLFTHGAATACLVNNFIQFMDTAVNQSNRMGWWFDEMAVNRATGNAVQNFSNSGWLGNPSDHFYNNKTPIDVADVLGTSGLFDSGGNQSEWNLNNSVYGAASFVTDTVMAGSALKMSGYSTQSGSGIAHIDYSSSVVSKVKKQTAVHDTMTVSFWARATFERPIFVAILGRDGALRSQYGHVWIGTTWKPYRISSVAADTMTVHLELWPGDTTGVVWMDSLKFQIGRFRGGSYIRQFEHGFVIVNPTPHADTVSAPIKCKRITSLGSINYNNGLKYAANAAIPVPAGESLFLDEDLSASTALPQHQRSDYKALRGRRRAR